MQPINWLRWRVKNKTTHTDSFLIFCLALRTLLTQILQVHLYYEVLALWIVLRNTVQLHADTYTRSDLFKTKDKFSSEFRSKIETLRHFSAPLSPYFHTVIKTRQIKRKTDAALTRLYFFLQGFKLATVSSQVCLQTKYFVQFKTKLCCCKQPVLL